MIAVRVFTPLAWTWYVLAGTAICMAVGMRGEPCQSMTRGVIVERARDAAGVVSGRDASTSDRAPAPIWSEAFGSAASTTPFDLASLTKVLATTTVVMELVRTGALAPRGSGAPTSLPSGAAPIATAVTVRDLLEHASGLPARLVDAPPAGRREFEHDICAIAARVRAADAIDLQRSRVHPARISRRGPRRRAARRAVRSDLAAASSSAVAARDARRRTSSRSLCRQTARVSPRRRSRWTKTRGAAAMLVGEVHDNYAAALGGVAGHAGLFGTAPAVGAFARAMLRAARGDATVAAAVLARTGPPVHHEEHGARQFARAGLGYDAADFVVRHADVAAGVRPRRIHRHVAVDRSGARSLLRAADQSRRRRRHARRDARRPPRVSRRARLMCNRSTSGDHRVLGSFDRP